MSDRLTDQQIRTLALAWPWTYDETERTLRLAEREGWPLDDTVRALDALAETFGEDADPEATVRAAVAKRRAERERKSWSTQPRRRP